VAAPSAPTPATTETSAKCPACGAANAPGSKFCLTCGTALAETGEGEGAASRGAEGLEVNREHQGLATVVAAEISDVQERLLDRIATLDKQIADLQMDQVRAGKPWWQTPSVLIALSAFLLSLTATTFSYIQSRQREQRDARVELRGLIQRISEIPREAATLTQVYTDGLTIAQLGGQLQQENAVLARQAREVMRLIPNDVTAGEYIVVANALANSNLLDDAIAMYKQAEGAISDYNDGISLYRSEAQLLFFTGEPDTGREYFQRALDIFNPDRFPTSSEYIRLAVTAETEMYWALSEYSIGQCNNARQHTKSAREVHTDLVQKYPSARSSLSALDLQLDQLERITRACLPR
jgi:tetratricopeptide (TPR) repeat protein